MKLWAWAEAFEERRTFEDILGKVHRTEVGYWIWLLLSIFIGFVGIGIVILAPANSLKMHAIGLLIAVEGMFWWAIIKIVVHVRLAMYWILWDSQNRLGQELRESEAADL